MMVRLGLIFLHRSVCSTPHMHPQTKPATCVCNPCRMSQTAACNIAAVQQDKEHIMRAVSLKRIQKCVTHTNSVTSYSTGGESLFKTSINDSEVDRFVRTAETLVIKFDNLLCICKTGQTLQSFAFLQTSRPAQVRCPAPSDCPAKFPAPTLHQRGPGERAGGTHEPHLHNQCMSNG